MKAYWSRLRYLLWLFLVFSLLFAAYSTLRLSLADWYSSRGSDEGLNRAIQLNPANPGYLLRRGAPDDLQAAARLAPSLSAPWIRLALLEEMRGDYSAAEASLRQALVRDQTFAPKWALVNYYFRRRNWPEFWKWSAAGAQIFTGDLTALFQLCLRSGASPGEVYSRVVPARHKARREFLELLISEKLLAEAAPAAAALAADHRPPDLPLLLGFCEQAITARHSFAARAVWEALHGPAPAIVNGSFHSEPTGRCLDWTLHPANGLSIFKSSTGLTLELSGLQPDPWVALHQPLTIPSGRRCRLRYRYRASAPLRWRIAGEESAVFRIGDAREDEWEFTTRESARLELLVSRATGASRPKGVVVVEWVRLD